MIHEGGSVQDARLHRVDSGEEICRCEWLERLQGRPLTFEMRNPRGPAGQPLDPSRMNGDFAIYTPIPSGSRYCAGLGRARTRAR